MASKKNRSVVKTATLKAGRESALAASKATPVVPSGAPTAVAVLPPAAEPAGRDRSTIIALIAKLRDPDAEVARDAAATLGRLPADAEAVDLLCDVVRNADGYFHPVVRTSAAAALGALKDRRAVEALITGVGDTMAEASEEAIRALGALSDPRAIETLEAAIRNDSGFFLEHVRTAARQALESLRTAQRKG